jgi:hypothetical protein
MNELLHSPFLNMTDEEFTAKHERFAKNKFAQKFAKKDENWGRYGDFELVGQGEKTNANCGRFVSFKGCLHTELHNKTTLEGVNYSGKVYVRKVHASCDKPTCPVCYKSGWAVREADRITQRIRAASKTAGLAEHIIVGVPKSD